MVESMTGRHKEADPQGRKIIIFVGPEGSGKSEHAKRLSQQLNLPYTSTGDIIRETAATDTGKLGDACRDMLKNNAYLDPTLIKEIIAKRLSNKDTANGLIIDGALRTLEETESFDETLELGGKGEFEVDVIFLDIPPQVGIERRLKSSKKRDDDTPQGIAKRQKHFYTNLEERVEIIKEKYNFRKVNALGTLDEVYSRVFSALNNIWIIQKQF